MRVFKLIWTVAFVLALFTYVPAYYASWNFNDLVKQETARIKPKPLRQMLLTQAGTYGVLLKNENIDITASDSVLRVAVDYRIPINFYLFEQELSFRTAASAPILAR